MKPNQVIDEIFDVIYPPAEAIGPELNTIRAIANATMALYEQTEEIRTIQPNLDMIQRAIDYLRGAPMRDELKPDPEDTLQPTVISYSAGTSITVTYGKDEQYKVMITGSEVEPKIHYPELFGDLDIDVVTVELGVPIICGHHYTVTQVNPLLELYQDDPSISELEDGTWQKSKTYEMTEDMLEYAFLLPSGRTQVTITIVDEDAEDSDNAEPIIFNVTSHIHFKEKEETDDSNG